MIKNIKPNLFIIGAPKSGTTFLYNKLQSLADFYFTDIKELNYFSFDEIVESKSYYNDYKVKEIEKYLKFYKNIANQKYIVDTSVSYFSYPKTADNIYNFNPDSKIIAILRNPIKRAFSHYLMDVRMGHANLKFKEYIENKDDYQAHYHQYINNSIYYTNISRYIQKFGKENVLVLILEDIESELPKLFDFLKVEDSSLKIDTDEKINANKKPKNFVSKFFQNNRRLAQKLKKYIPNSLVHFYKKYFYEKADKISITEEEFQICRNLLSQEVSELSKLLNKDLFEIWQLNEEKSKLD